jgi:hypothetical protein
MRLSKYQVHTPQYNKAALRSATYFKVPCASLTGTAVT